MSRTEEQEIGLIQGIGNPGDTEVGLRFESPPGTVVGLEFTPGQAVRVCGKLTTSTGLPGSWLSVELKMWPLDPEGAFSPIIRGSNANTAGNYWFDITLPSVIAQARVQVTAGFWPFPASNSADIGIGTVAPPPDKPWWDTFKDVIIYGSIGLFVVAGVVLLGKGFSQKR